MKEDLQTPNCDVCRLPLYEGMINVSCEMCVTNEGERLIQQTGEIFRMNRHRYYLEKAIDDAWERNRKNENY